MVPDHFSEAEARQWALKMAGRIERKRASEAVDLELRATQLAARYRLEKPHSIEWSDRQNDRWGSATPANGSIRISNRLAGSPSWVLDYVIVHELAHLSEAGHGPRFHELVDRFPLAERARGYLIAKAEGPVRS